MRIQNVRLGFASNSSSTHSIVILDKKSKLSGVSPLHTKEYGWEEFALKSSPTKRSYIAVVLFTQLEKLIGSEMAALVTASWTGKVPYEFINSEVYIDHQSLAPFPVNHITGHIDKEFFGVFMSFLERADVAILGGNDNEIMDYVEPEGWPERGENRKPLNEFIGGSEGEQGRVIKSGPGHWTIFNQDSGAKVRFAEEGAEPLHRSIQPELVDMKITDYCKYNCEWCYQDSTYKGEHAKLTDLRNYIWELKQLGVFEVAFGGGEPTEHPDFVELLEIARVSYGIVPNFTTRNIHGWESELIEAVENHVGGFAVSVYSGREVYAAQALAYHYGYHVQEKMSVQFVLGMHPIETLESVLKAANDVFVPVTLLGMKGIGRASHLNSDPHNQNGWLALVDKYDYKLSVDTVMVERHGDKLKELGIPDILMVPGEGRFSMYIDAVKRLAGISSYHKDTFVSCKAGWSHNNKYFNVAGAWKSFDVPQAT